MNKLQGLTLIEVMISFLILSLVLLGFDAMEMFALRQNREAYFFNLAADQLYSMKERLHAHALNLDLPQQVAIWNQENFQLLPQAKGYVTSKSSQYQITLFWGEKTNLRTCKKINSGKLHCLTLATVI